MPRRSRVSKVGPAAPASDGGGLADILGKLQQQMGAQGGAAGSGGGLMDILGQVLGQATTGVKEGAQRIDQATGASDRMRDAISQATGKSPDDLLNQLKELIANNPGGAAAAGAGLGAVVLGTQAGRALAGSAVKLGALALIGGLAYKAMQNYQQGKPLIGSAQDPRQMGLIEAPRGSGFRGRRRHERGGTALHPRHDRGSGSRRPHRCRRAAEDHGRPEAGGARCGGRGIPGR